MDTYAELWNRDKGKLICITLGRVSTGIQLLNFTTFSIANAKFCKRRRKTIFILYSSTQPSPLNVSTQIDELYCTDSYYLKK